MSRLDEVIRRRKQLDESQTVSLKRVKQDCDWLIARVERLEQALKFYAGPDLSKTHEENQRLRLEDYGEIAREALSEADEEGNL
jgi:hypothetical protein